MKNKIESNIAYLAITETEILKRKQLLRFSLTGAQILGQFKDRFLEKMDFVTDEFISSVKSIPGFSRFIDISLDHVIPALKICRNVFQRSLQQEICWLGLKLV